MLGILGIGFASTVVAIPQWVRVGAGDGVWRRGRPPVWDPGGPGDSMRIGRSLRLGFDWPVPWGDPCCGPRGYNTCEVVPGDVWFGR